MINSYAIPRAFRPILFFGLLALGPLPASADTLGGKLNGHDCAERGEACPVDRLDPHLMLESDFVLQRADGEYFFLVNIPREVKVRHVLETIEVSGDVNGRYNTIDVDIFKVGDRVVWSKELQREEARRAYWPGALTSN